MSDAKKPADTGPITVQINGALGSRILHRCQHEKENADEITALLWEQRLRREPPLRQEDIAEPEGDDPQRPFEVDQNHA